MTVYRGILTAWDGANYKATVRLDGSAPQVLADVHTSRGIATGEMVTGRRVLVDTGDHGDIADTVLFAVYT